ncbi:MAG: putative zinc-binding protein [Methanomassiliicoccales archaeon]|jgi:uncharacterized metal-binding protein|nr:putative zinc-binding protein [Methanomassiliicoccales archaeon]
MEPEKMPYVFLCHGAANVGQLSNDAARELFNAGRLRIACVAAVGAHDQDFIAPFRSGRRIFCVDGCPKRCASRTLGEERVPIVASMVVTDLGIRKNHDLHLRQRDIDLVRAGIEDLITKE